MLQQGRRIPSPGVGGLAGLAWLTPVMRMKAWQMLAGLAWLTPLTRNAGRHVPAGVAWLTPLMCNASLQMLAGLAWLTPVMRMQARQAQEAAAQHSRRRWHQRRRR